MDDSYITGKDEAKLTGWKPRNPVLAKHLYESFIKPAKLQGMEYGEAIQTVRRIMGVTQRHAYNVLRFLESEHWIRFEGATRTITVNKEKNVQ